jgi:ethanolamine transporter EutH
MLIEGIFAAVPTPFFVTKWCAVPLQSNWGRVADENEAAGAAVAAAVADE